MSEQVSDTPRTDAEECWAYWNDGEFRAVDSEFARGLERELNALRKAVADRNPQLQSQDVDVA